MCKIFDLCTELEEPEAFPELCEDLFQAIKTIDFTSDTSEQQPQQQQPGYGLATQAYSRNSSFLGKETVQPLAQPCMSEGSMFSLLVEDRDEVHSSQVGQDCGFVEENVDADMDDLVAANGQPQAPVQLSTKQPTVVAKPPAIRKRRRNKTQEEIKEQQEKLRCRRRDAAARSRKRKAEYVKTLEEENEGLHRRIQQLEEQLAKCSCPAAGQSRLPLAGDGYGAATPRS